MYALYRASHVPMNAPSGVEDSSADTREEPMRIKRKKPPSNRSTHDGPFVVIRDDYSQMGAVFAQTTAVLEEEILGSRSNKFLVGGKRSTALDTFPPH